MLWLAEADRRDPQDRPEGPQGQVGSQGATGAHGPAGPGPLVQYFDRSFAVLAETRQYAAECPTGTQVRGGAIAPSNTSAYQLGNEYPDADRNAWVVTASNDGTAANKELVVRVVCLGTA